MKKSDLILWGIGAVALYFIYKKVIAPLVVAPANALATGIANLWLTLTLSPPMQVLGNVVFPDGSQVPLSQFSIGTDSKNNVYVQSGGVTYQLHPHDANGNWPATVASS
ncbi:MAG: hypothetical protein ACREQ5_02950 [Candidatus Dormibacteria bacterium]